MSTMDREKINRAVKGMVQRHLESKFPGREVRINWEGHSLSPPEERAYRLLELLAQKAGNTGEVFDPVVLGSELGFTREESDRAGVWLSREDYVNGGYQGISIMDRGRDKVETLQAKRSQKPATDAYDRQIE